MPSYMTIRPFPSEEELNAGWRRLRAALDANGIVNRIMTYVFEVPGQGIVGASCFDAPDAATIEELTAIADLPKAMVRPVLLDRKEGAGTLSGHGLKTYVVHRGKVCGHDELQSVADRTAAVEAEMADDLKRMETWLYDEDGGVGMLSIYQAKSTRVIDEHSKRSAIPIVAIYEAHHVVPK
jgi:hypothetical protein